MRFTWDENKNRTKHGVDFEDANLVFFDRWSLVQRDRVVEGEQRGELWDGPVASSFWRVSIRGTRRMAMR